MYLFALVVAVFFLSYSNGANDNFKGVATLYGSRTTGFKKALLWATVTTFAGSLVSILLASTLLKTFSGKGLVPDALLGTPHFLIAIGAASAITIFLATWIGMPTSTTHAITGALLGVAILTSSGGGYWKVLANSFIGPLLISPLAAIFLAGILYFLFRRMGKMCGITKQTCVCLEESALEPVMVRPDGSMTVASTGLHLRVDQVQNCVERYQGHLVGVDAQTSIDATHYLSGGAVCFSRAVNDTPKIAALLFAVPSVTHQFGGLLVLALAMALGGLLSARRVAETMSKRITDLSRGQGLCANLTTSFLVLVASRLGVPVSTTHVVCGSLFGIGMVKRTAQWKTIAQILVVWVTTLPVAVLLSGLIFMLVK